MKPATVVSVVGARPQFIKLAPVCRSLEDMAPDWRHVIIHTGQHYDYGMSEVFFEDLNIPRPDRNLNVGSGKQGTQTAAMLAALEAEFEAIAPDGLIVYGDTNSTLAAAIAASKMPIRQFHVEAGLRSFDRGMPEEVNRIVADHCAELLFAPTATAMENLAREGLADRARLVGDVMYDAVLYNADIARQNSNVLAGLGVSAGRYAVATVHRASNTNKDKLEDLMLTLGEIARDRLPVVFPMHPRTAAAFEGAPVPQDDSLRIVSPQSYLDMLALVQNAKLVLTDSGGLQKEAAFLKTPCVTLRDTTEWTETVDMGANRLTGLSREAIVEAVDGILAADGQDWEAELPRHYGEGRAADNIAAAVIERLAESRRGVKP